MRYAQNLPFRYALLLLLLAGAGCEETVTEPAKSEQVPVDAAEGELVALQLAGSLHAPADLAGRVAAELQEIRSTFAAVAPEIRSIRHRAPWSPSGLLMVVDEATARAIRNQTYTAWDDLNQANGLVEVNSISSVDVLHLKFDRVAHPCRLAELYLTLPGILLVEPNNLVGDGPNVYARDVDGERSYLFRRAHGDCPAGCLYSEYWYFEPSGDGPTLVGTWNRQEELTPPEWWSRARQNVDLYVRQCHK